MKRAHRYLVGTISGFALTASATAFIYQSTSASPSSSAGLLPRNDRSERGQVSRMTVDHSFRTLFAVPLSCDGCVRDVSDALYKLSGISKVEGSVENQSFSIEGTAPPSAIVKAIQATGRDAILRGSGSSNSAAVSILETYYQPDRKGAVAEASEGNDTGDFKDRFVRGLVRMVQVSPCVTVIDLTMLGVAPGIYHASIREFGDLKDGVLSTGPVWSGDGVASSVSANSSQKRRGALGTIEVGPDGQGAVFLDRPFQVWEVIGHAFVVSPLDESKNGATLQNNENTVVGVIARSAGVWDNDKTVCSCSGKTLWEERKDEVKKGMF